MLSGRGNDLLPCFPEIRACLETLSDLVIDGELVVLDELGRSQFQPLRRGRSWARRASSPRPSREEPAVVFAFDLIALRGKGLRMLPLLARTAMLKTEKFGVSRDDCAARSPKPARW